MQESIGEIVTRGFDTWKRNPVLNLPYVIQTILVYAIVLMATAPFTSYLQPSDIYDMTIGDGETLMLQNPAASVVYFLAVLIIAVILYPFFQAGTISMAQEAMAGGQTSMGILWRSGSRHYLNLLAANVLAFSIMMMVALAFVLINDIMPFMGLPVMIFIMAGSFIAVIAVLLSLSPAPYILVIKGTGPINAIKESIRFFRENQIAVVAIEAIFGGIFLATWLIGQAIDLTGVAYISVAWSLVGAVAENVVAFSLVAVLWTRLYMARTGRLSEAKDT